MQIVWNRELKKLVAVFSAIFFMSCVVGNLCFDFHSQQMRMEYTELLATMLGNVLAAYPDVSEEELIRVLNDEGNEEIGVGILARYGIFAEQGSESFVGLEQRIRVLKAGSNTFLLLMFAACGAFFLRYFFGRQKRISQLEDYMEVLNREGYKLRLEDNEDDELSGLRNEIYKLAVSLKEQAGLAAAQKRAMADSVADISHQLKTPLTSVTVLLDNLTEDEEMDGGTRRRFLTEISRQLTGMSWLITTMLKLSRLDAGVVELERKPLSARQLIEETLQRLEIAAEWKGITFGVEIIGNAMLIVDEKWTVEALVNIVKNAVEHSPAGSCVEISAEENEVYTRITIQDYGEGLKEEQREKLFRRFYNGNSLRADSVGIGLSLAKEIVEKQKGSISVDSKKDGGTSFVLKFLK